MLEEYNAAPFTQRRPFVAANPHQKELEEERREILSQVPLLAAELKRLDERIEATDSVKQAFAIAKQYDTSNENALIVLDIVRQQLETERNEIRKKVDKLIKK